MATLRNLGYENLGEVRKNGWNPPQLQMRNCKKVLRLPSIFTRNLGIMEVQALF